MPKFGTKNAWFMCFWAGIWKQYCHIWNQHPRICLISKFRGKNALFGTKNALFGYFRARILKNYCHIWNQHPKICRFAKFHKRKTKISKFGTKNAWFRYFWAGTWMKTILSYLKSAPSNLPNCKILRKNKND